MQMDIEGYEEALLGVELSVPAVIEVHGLQLRDKFLKKGYRISYSNFDVERGFACCSYAFWKC